MGVLVRRRFSPAVGDFVLAPQDEALFFGDAVL
jgi:hypothetical protein